MLMDSISILDGAIAPESLSSESNLHNPQFCLIFMLLNLQNIVLPIQIPVISVFNHKCTMRSVSSGK